MPVVIVPTPYRGPTRGEGEVAVEGTSVLACLRAVEEKSPGFLELVLDEAGRPHRFVRLFLNEEPLETVGLDVEVSADDRVEVLAAIGGG